MGASLDALLDVAGSACLLLGLTLATIGLYGLLRKPDIFHQLHPAGLVTGPSVILVLLSALATGNAEITTSALLVVAFILVTSSVSGHAVAQAAFRYRAREGEPRTLAVTARGVDDGQPDVGEVQTTLSAGRSTEPGARISAAGGSRSGDRNGRSPRATGRS